MTSHRFRSDYRADEVALITDLARRGLSCALVGIAGVGKSNLLNSIRTQYRTLQPATGPALTLTCIILNGANWDGSPAGFWRLARQEAEQTLGANSNIIPLSSDQSDRDNQILRRLLGDLCAQPNQRVLFVLDDCDTLLQRAPLDLLEQLRTLRDENRDRLGFLLFVKRLPHRLGEASRLRTDSKFYELFSSNIYALRPYQQSDARHMLSYLNAQSDRPLSAQALAHILRLAGGHPMLIKRLYELWLAQPGLAQPPTEVVLVGDPDIQDACARILRSLEGHEQSVLSRLAQAQPLDPADAPALVMLEKRGLLAGPAHTFFSPLLREYLREFPI